jgi:hypothetical protein
MHHGSRWTKTEDRLLGTDSDAQVAKRLGRTRMAVISRRQYLNIKARLPRHRVGRKPKWGPLDFAMLGRYPDTEVAKITGRSLKEVKAKRKELRGEK